MEVKNLMMRIINFIFEVLKKFLTAYRQRRLEKQKSQSDGFDFELKIKFKRRKD